MTGYTLSVDPWDDLDLGGVEEPDLSQVDTFVLHAELRRLDGQLAAMGEILKAVSPEARDLHSRRGAIVVILKNRKAL